MQSVAVGSCSGNERNQKQDGVDRNGGPRVQRVEANGAPIRIIDWYGQQMIGIHHHRRDHEQRRTTPAATVERQRHKQRDEEVQGDVDHDRDVCKRVESQDGWSEATRIDGLTSIETVKAGSGMKRNIPD